MDDWLRELLGMDSNSDSGWDVSGDPGSDFGMYGGDVSPSTSTDITYSPSVVSEPAYVPTWSGGITDHATSNPTLLGNGPVDTSWVNNLVMGQSPSDGIYDYSPVGDSSLPSWANPYSNRDVADTPPASATTNSPNLPGIPIHYTELRPVIDAGSDAPTSRIESPSVMSQIENFLKDNKNLLSLAGGGLQGIMAYLAQQKAKKAYDDNKNQAVSTNSASQAKRDAQQVINNRPIDYARYDVRRQQLNPGVSDYRLSAATPESRTYFAAMPDGKRLIRQIPQEAVRAKTGGLMAMKQGGQADNIRSMLSPGEFIMDAATVSDLGDGNTEAGAAKLEHMRQAIRAHKRSAPVGKIPPAAKSLSHYLGDA